MKQSSSNSVRIATKIGPRHQVTIPREVFTRLRLDVGDYLEFELCAGVVSVTPKKLIPKEDSWFYSPEWQAKEREADRAIENGDVSGPFLTASSLLRHLKNGKKDGKKKRAK